MRTKFLVGQTVTATANVQRLSRGAGYKVTSVEEQTTPFGTFVTYVVSSNSTPREGLKVVNGHLILK